MKIKAVERLTNLIASLTSRLFHFPCSPTAFLISRDSSFSYRGRFKNRPYFTFRVKYASLKQSGSKCLQNNDPISTKSCYLKEVGVSLDNTIYSLYIIAMKIGYFLLLNPVIRAGTSFDYMRRSKNIGACPSFNNKKY